MNRILLILLSVTLAAVPAMAQQVKDEMMDLSCREWTKVGDHEWKQNDIHKQGNVTVDLMGRVVKNTAETKVLDGKCGK